MSEIINGFISSAITTLNVYFFGYLILKNEDYQKKSKLRVIIILLVSILIHNIIFLTVNGAIKPILLCILFTLTFRILYNRSYIKSLFASILLIILAIFPDLIVLTITTKVLGISKEFCYTQVAGSIISNSAVCILMILMVCILREPLKKIINYELSTSKKILVVSLLTLISLAIFFYRLISRFRISNDIYSYLIAIIALVIILFYLFKQQIDNDIILKRYDDLLNIMKNYESDIEEQRTLIHESKNELMTIKCKIKDKEKESAIIKYIDSIIGDKASSNATKYSKFKYLPSNGLRGFFYYKFIEAEKRGINVSVNISKQIEKSFLGELKTEDFKDLVRIIGVYLDNAIDASSESNDKKLGIEIYLIKKDIEIIISNTFVNDIDTEKIGKETFTTKGKNHGYGLLLVKRILYSKKMFTSENRIVENLYVQKLKISNTKKLSS